MAKQKVPLSKPTGSDGEGNIKVPGGPMVLDLGDFDDVFGQLDDSPSKGPLGQFYDGLKSSLAGRFKTKEVVRNFLRAAAPDGISNAMGFVNESINISKDIKSSLEQTNASDLHYIAKRAQELLPKLKDSISEKAYNNISQGLEDKIDEYDYTVQSQRDKTRIRRDAANTAADNEIREALDNIALSDKLNHNRSEQAADARHTRDRAEQSIRDLLTSKRFDFMSRSMGLAVDNLQRISGYNEQVNYGFQRKGLELQFRSYLGIKELVKLNEANLELNARAYNALVRNTGLTDFQKQSEKGLLNIGNETNNTGFVGRMMQKVGNKTLSNFLGGYSQDVQSRITDNLRQKLSTGSMLMRMGDSTPDLWSHKYSLAGNFAGDYLADFLLQDVVPTLGREARGPLTKLSDRFGGIHNKLGYQMDNMPSMMQEFVNNGQNQYGWKGKLREMIAPFVPQFGLNDRLQDGTFQTIDQPTQFKQSNSRSINEAIPGYLARILQEIRMVRTGSDNVGREVFDFTTGMFVVQSTADDNLLNKVVPKHAIRSASTTINDTINQMDEDGNLSPDARKALAERLLRDASTNKRFDPEAYIRGREYAKDTDPEVAKELEQFFRDKFEFTDKGKMVDNADNQRLRQQFSQSFLDIRSVSRDPINEINRLINSGTTEPLRALGIIVTENGVEKINYPRIWEMLRAGVTDDNPYSPNGSRVDPYREDRSGMAGHKDFVGPEFPGHGKAWVNNKVARFRAAHADDEQALRDRINRYVEEALAQSEELADNPNWKETKKSIRKMVRDARDQIKSVGDDDDQSLRDRTAKRIKQMRRRFSKANQVTDSDYAVNTPTDYKDGIKSFTQMMTDAAKGQGYANQLQDGYSNFVQGVVKAHQELPGYVAKGMEELTDLYSSFDPTQPIIKGIDFSKGDLIDVNTQKIITKPSDITGTVINTLGQTVVNATELASGLMGPKGNIVVQIAEHAKGLIGKALNMHRSTNTSSEATDSTGPTEQLNDQDWSMGPGEEPVITARGIKAGEYFDAAGKVLGSIADIASDVYDRSGNLVLTARDYANGLWSARTGKKYRPTKNLSKLLNLVKSAGKYSGRTTSQLIGGAIKFGAKAALGIGMKAFNFMVDNQNAYLPGDPNPVFTRRALQNGEYYDSKGNVITDFRDVYDPIVNSQGELVIPPEQYKELKNWDGSKHVLAKNRKLWAKFISRPLRFMRDKYIAGTKKYYSWLGRKAVNTGSWLGRKTLGGFARSGEKLFNKMFDSVEDPNTRAQIDATLMASNQQTSAIEAVRQAINDLKPKEKRKGSWQEMADRKSSDTSSTKDPETEDKQQSLLKRGLAGLASLFGFGKKGKDEDDDEDGFGLEDAADLAEIGDAVDGAKERRRKRRMGKGVRRKGGLIARGWGWLKDSKLGKLVGTGVDKVAGTKVGQKVASWAGKSAVGRFAAGAVTAALGVGFIGEAGIAAAGASAMYLYGSIKDSSGEFKRLRLAQYGIRGMRRELKVLKLESMLEKFTDRSSDVPSFSLASAGAKDIIEAMGLDLDNKEEVLNFARWLELRFKPIYLAWISGMTKIGQSQVPLNQIDDKVPKELKADLLQAVRFPYTGDTPYAVLINPFDPDDTVDDNSDQISKMFDELRAEYDPERKKDDPLASDRTIIGKAKAMGAATTLAAATGQSADATSTPSEQPKDSKQYAKNLAEEFAKSVGKPTAGVIATTSTSLMSGKVNNDLATIGDTLTELQAMRMRAYGLQVLHLAEVRALLSLEAYYVKDLSLTEDSLDYNGDDAKLLATAGELLGKNVAVGSEDRVKLVNWLAERFAPTFRAYYATAKKLNPSANLRSMEYKLKSSDKVTVGAAILGAVFHHDRTVWQCASIFPVKGSLYDLKRLADADLEELRRAAEREVVNSPTQKGSDQLAGKNVAEQGGSFADKVVGTIKDTWTSTKETVSTAWNRSKEAVGDTIDSAKIAVGMGPEYGGDGKAAGGTVQSQGTKGNVIQGNGGQWESIPYPSADGSIKAAYPTLKAVAEMTGVPVDWLLVIAGIESGFRYTVKAGTSSAEGWYQFINSTWDALYAKYGSMFGCPVDKSKSRAERRDPRINALMGAMFIKDNYNGLKKALGRDNITDTDVYMAHFLGLGGAIKFFKADPNMMAYKVFKKEYSANMPLFFVNSKPGQPRTIQQLYQLFQQKIEKFWQTTGKGYRTGEAADITENKPEAQVPGETKVDEAAQTTANLKEDAQGSDGEVTSSSEAKPDASIKQGDPNKPTVQSLARGTAPMPSTPTTGGGASTSVSTTGTASGGEIAESGQNAQFNAAQSQNIRRQKELQRDKQTATEVAEVFNSQLERLIEIRDLMKTQVEQTRNLAASLGSKSQQQSNNGGSGNNMNPSGIKGRAAADRQSAVTLR